MPTPCTVTGNLISLLGVTAAYGTVNFQLTNTGIGTIPRVISTGLFPLLNQTVQADSNGLVSTLLWGNDNIDPSNTLYLVTFRDQNRNEIVQCLFSITGSTFNLNTAVPASTTLPPVLIYPGHVNRIIADLGSQLVSGDFSLLGWGAGASIGAIVGTDTWNTFTITAGASPSSAPTVTLTYHDGTWGNIPIIVAWQIGGTGQRSDLSTSGLSQTQAVITYLGLPVNAATYTFVVSSVGHP